MLIACAVVLGLGTTFAAGADLVVAGSTEDQRAFEKILEESTGLDLSMEAGTGKVSLPTGSAPAGKAKFTELLRGVISDRAVTVTLTVGRNFENVLVGSFEGDGKQLLDLDDVEKFEIEGAKGLNTQASKVIHEIREAYEAKKHNLSYDEAHKRATEAENAVLKDQGSGQRVAAREDCQFPNGPGDFKLYVSWTLHDGTTGFEKYEGRVELKADKRFVQLAKVSFVRAKSALAPAVWSGRRGDVAPICLYQEAPRLEKTGAIPLPGVDASRVGVDVGNFAPNFLLPMYQGNRIRLANLRGRKVVLNFWASWCSPCILEKPLLQNVLHEGRRGKIILLGINLGESLDEIEFFLKQVAITQKVQITFPLLMDSNPPFDVTRAYKIFTQPATFFIDERGVIVYVKTGAFTKEELEQAVSEFEKQGGKARLHAACELLGDRVN
jgi:peroxiredoxin